MVNMALSVRERANDLESAIATAVAQGLRVELRVECDASIGAHRGTWSVKVDVLLPVR